MPWPKEAELQGEKRPDQDNQKDFGQKDFGRQRGAEVSARPTLGSLLRGLRARHSWTLKEMSERTGIPVSTLSKVEHDRLTLTYDKLLQLSEKLNLRMSELFAEPNADAPEAPVTARRSIGHKDQAIRVNTSNYDYFYLCPELRRKRMVPVLVEIRAKSLGEFGDLVRHSGEEFVYVIEGRVAIHTEFYDPIVLSAGQSIYIDSNMGHAYVAAPGCDVATIMGVCSSADEGLMESLLTLHGEEATLTPVTITDPTSGGTPRKLTPARVVEPVKRVTRARS
ncbi:MAG: transcriptional regulator, family [Rhodospirillales bacterium]|nr:transcriptional regulator, family [Rhodospirillales bacterium]